MQPKVNTKKGKNSDRTALLIKKRKKSPNTAYSKIYKEYRKRVAKSIKVLIKNVNKSSDSELPGVMAKWVEHYNIDQELLINQIKATNCELFNSMINIGLDYLDRAGNSISEAEKAKITDGINAFIDLAIDNNCGPY